MIIREWHILYVLTFVIIMLTMIGIIYTIDPILYRLRRLLRVKKDEI